MACYHPIAASQDRPGAELRLWPPLGSANLALPCGKCLGCRTDKATMWANRCTHEASGWRHNTFITLTYDDDHIPPSGHLTPRDLQLFIKRLRKHASGNTATLVGDRTANIRYLACGEYGETNGRPHYHALLFNAAFNDTYRVAKDYYESETLSTLWTYGTHKIGDVTPRSASYVAQYNVKKQGRRTAHPGYINPTTGEWTHKRQKGFYRYDDGSPPQPFLRMSLKPAIGADWLTEYATDLQHGYLVQGTRKHPIPRYYRDKIKEHYPELKEYIQTQIEKHRATLRDKKDTQRLADTEIIHTRRKQLTAQRQL